MDYVTSIRNKIGHQCLILTSGNLIIHDEQGYYYLQRKHNNKLAFVGGFIETSESVVEGTAREAKEEVDLDLDCTKLNMYGIYSQHQMQYPNGDIVKPHSIFFKYQLDEGEQLRAVEPETLEVVKTRLSSDLVMINQQHTQVLHDLLANVSAVVLK